MINMDEDNDKRYLLQDINEMKNGQFEQMYLITIYSLSNYFKSLFAFGKESTVTKDNLMVIKEMFEILKTERKLLNFILRNMDKIDCYSAELVVGLLDETNDKTVKYFYQVMGDIDEACELKDEMRGKRVRKSFPTLTQDNCYSEEVVALCENSDSLKEFFGYEDEFWHFIKTRIKIADLSDDIVEKMTYAIPIYNEDDIVVGLDLLIPKVVDLNTALLAISLYAKAYKIYQSIGKKYTPLSQEEIDEVRHEYRSKYLGTKINRILK